MGREERERDKSVGQLDARWRVKKSKSTDKTALVIRERYAIRLHLVQYNPTPDYESEINAEPQEMTQNNNNNVNINLSHTIKIKPQMPTTTKVATRQNFASLGRNS